MVLGLVKTHLFCGFRFGENVNRRFRSVFGVWFCIGYTQKPSVIAGFLWFCGFWGFFFAAFRWFLRIFTA